MFSHYSIQTIALCPVSTTFHLFLFIRWPRDNKHSQHLGRSRFIQGYRTTTEIPEIFYEPVFSLRQVFFGHFVSATTINNCWAKTEWLKNCKLNSEAWVLSKCYALLNLHTMMFSIETNTICFIDNIALRFPCILIQTYHHNTRIIRLKKLNLIIKCDTIFTTNWCPRTYTVYIHTISKLQHCRQDTNIITRRC